MRILLYCVRLYVFLGCGPQHQWESLRMGVFVEASPTGKILPDSSRQLESSLKASSSSPIMSKSVSYQEIRLEEDPSDLQGYRIYGFLDRDQKPVLLERPDSWKWSSIARAINVLGLSGDSKQYELYHQVAETLASKSENPQLQVVARGVAEIQPIRKNSLFQSKGFPSGVSSVPSIIHNCVLALENPHLLFKERVWVLGLVKFLKKQLQNDGDDGTHNLLDHDQVTRGELELYILRNTALYNAVRMSWTNSRPEIPDQANLRLLEALPRVELIRSITSKIKAPEIINLSPPFLRLYDNFLIAKYPLTDLMAKSFLQDFRSHLIDPNVPFSHKGLSYPIWSHLREHNLSIKRQFIETISHDQDFQRAFYRIPALKTFTEILDRTKLQVLFPFKTLDQITSEEVKDAWNVLKIPTPAVADKAEWDVLKSRIPGLNEPADQLDLYHAIIAASSFDQKVWNVINTDLNENDVLPLNLVSIWNQLYPKIVLKGYWWGEYQYLIFLKNAGLKEAAQRMLFTRDLKISNENSIEHRISSLPWKSEQVDFQFVSKLVSDILTQLQSSIGSSEALESAYFQCLFHLYAARESEAIQLIVDKSSRDTQLAHHLHQIAEKTIGAKQTDSYINAIGIRTFAGELKTLIYHNILDPPQVDVDPLHDLN